MSALLYRPDDLIFMMWLLLAAPAHGLLFAQIAPRVGTRPLRWTEGVKYGFAFFGALMSTLYALRFVFMPFYRDYYPWDVYWHFDHLAYRWFVLAFVITILLFTYEYKRRFAIKLTVALFLALVQTVILLATIGLWNALNLLIELLD